MTCSNVIIIGCPGAGKSTVGAIAAKTLGMKYIDFDLDILEHAWGMKVGDKLITLGSDKFLEAEAEQFLKFTTTNSVIALSGSNPMHPKFKPHAQSLGKVFFLDVRHEDILKYINKKTLDASNSIVGKHDGMTWEEIIDYRQQFYVQNYDIRILCEQNESPKSVAEKVVRKWKSLESNSFYVSSRSSLKSTEEEMKFLDTVIHGLAVDGGLYVPKGEIPYFTLGQWRRLITLPYQERAARILESWVDSSELHPSLIQQMIANAYGSFQDKEVAPIKKLDNSTYIQELFHGPTASFKDLALQLMPQIFHEAARKCQQRSPKGIKHLVLVATSGDTGSAVLRGFQDCENVAVIVLYPEKGISAIQRQQMTSIDAKNVNVLGVKADFDFCQTAVKQIFVDQDFTSRVWENYGYKFTAANSINWGRLLPQVVYHASGYLDLVKQGEITLGEPIDICVPTGNFGNILAAFYAKEMGIPIETLICASNTNNILTDFFTTGKYDLRGRHLQRSTSPSIDILKSSNLERFLYHMTKDGAIVDKLFRQLATEKHFQISEELRQKIAGFIETGWTSDAECKTTIKTCFEESNYVLDPHTAVGLNVIRKRAPFTRKVLLSGTAHYSKFGKDVLLALGLKPNSESPCEVFKQLEKLNVKPAMNKRLQSAMGKQEIHNDVCMKDLNAVKQKIENFLNELTSSS